MVCAAFQRVGTYYYLLPTYAQAKKILWDGRDKEGFKFMDHLPREIVARSNETELRKELENLPGSLRDKLLPFCDRMGCFTRLQGRLVRIAQEAVDQLQLDVKYLMFDLEATRRERDTYRDQLEDLLE